ncbi:MAG TPA: MFS transporter [Thermomicrobiales bacterium]|nr:MFS transporter [Thermomicrobiales bacterium]
MNEPPVDRHSSQARLRLLLPVLSVVFIAALDLTVVAPILPTVIVDLGISAVDADRYSWIVLSYLVAYTVTVPITGRISDFAGRIPVFAVAMALFLVGSVVVATADTLGSIIAGRTLQGLGGGAMLPVSMALVADVVPVRQRAATLGLVAAVDTFGWVLGPVWGALIFEAFGSWRAIFWINLPLGAIAAAVLLTARSGARRRNPVELPALLPAVVGTFALVAFCLALSSGGEGSLSADQGAAQLGASTNPLADYRWQILAASLVAFVGFVLLERRAERPVLPLALIRQRVFQVAGAANLLVGSALIVAMVNAPLAIAVLSDEERASIDTAILLGSFTLAMTVGAITGGRLVNRLQPSLTAAMGLVTASTGFLMMAMWPAMVDLLLQSTTIAVAGLGLGVVIAPIGEVAIRAARDIDYGAASGLVLVARLLGMTIGLAGVTAFGLERLNRRVGDLPPISPMPGESTANYFVRQQEYLTANLIPLTLDVIHETFLIAALLCAVSIAVVSRMRVPKT